MDELKKNFYTAFDTITSVPNVMVINIDGDDKFYLKKTKYNIEIRSDESRTWLAYVRIPTDNDMSYREHLYNKYLDLVHHSDPKHFEALKEEN